MGVNVTAFRTQIDDCETTTNWSGGTLNDAFNLEGTNCLGEKVSQTTGSEIMYTFPGANPDMTGNFIVIPMQVTGTADSIANGGYRILAEDGAGDRGTWYVGGNDTTNEKWSYFFVDPSTPPTLLNGATNTAGAVTSITASGTTATCTTTSLHLLATGDYVIISGANESEYNGYFQVTVTSGTVFTYTMASAPSITTATGTITWVQGIDVSDIDKVGVQFKVTSKSVGNTPNALWDICWYGSGLAVTSTTDSVTLTRSGSTVTVSSTAHGLTVGQKVRIAGATQTDYNGDWEIATVPNANSYTYDIGTATPTSPATGTITSRVHATWQDVADADAAGFWGMIRQVQGVFFMQGRFQLGSDGGAGDLLFVDEDFKCIFRENLFLDPGANNILPARNALTDEVDIELFNGIISSFNTRWGWSYVISNETINTVDINTVTFEGMQGFVCDSNSAHTYTNCRWNNVESLIPDVSTLTGCTFSNAAEGSLGMTWPGTTNNIDDMSFVGNTFSVLMTQTTNQTFDGMVFDDFGTDIILINSDTDIDVINSNGSNANSYLGVNQGGGGGVITFINDVGVTFANLKDNTEVRVYDNATGVEIDGIENAVAGSPDDRSFTALADAAAVVYYIIHNVDYEYIQVNNFTWPSLDSTIVVQQRIDRNVDDPP